MSCAYIKKYEKNHSAERRAPVDSVPNRCRSSSHKRAKPYKIESRWTLFDEQADWATHKRYATAEARDQALRKLQREYPKTQPNGRVWGVNIEYR